MFHFVGESEFVWYSPETTQEIRKAIESQGEGAYLKLRPYWDRAKGKWRVDWSVPIKGKSTADNGVPGGDDSNNCPPDCP